MNTKIPAQSLQKFIKDLSRLQPEYSGSDRTWLLPMRTGEKSKDWSLARVTHYQNTYYFSWTVCDLSLELDLKGKTTNSALENLYGADLKNFPGR